MMLAEVKNISAEAALELYYQTKVSEQLSSPKYGLHLMSDKYILEDILKELDGKEDKKS